ncbi:50S ribosomal protein L20 [Patescibacteria group bacterium]|nr:50S ribosomal protein L20 [Patescibacteria group bacterium]
MVRVKRGKAAHKRRKRLLKHTRGFRWGRKSKYRAAKEAILHAWKYSYRDRRTKKRDFRRLWQIQINAACRQHGLSYNRFIYGLKQKRIELDRKILATIARGYPKIFEKIVSIVKE